MNETFSNTSDVDKNKLKTFGHIRGFNFEFISNKTKEDESQKILSTFSESANESQLTICSQLWFISLIGLLIVIIFSALVVLNLRRKNQKVKNLMKLTLQPSNTPKLSLKGDQQIEFVISKLNVSEKMDISVFDDSFNKFDCISLNHEDQCVETPPLNRFEIKSGSIQSSSIKHYQTFGKVNFVLHYSFLRQQLLFTLLSAVDLPLARKRNTLNAYAKITLLPQKISKFVTKVQRNTQNPIFNEMFVFPIKVESLEKQILRISIWDCDRLSRKYFIGQVEYKLKEAGLTSCIKNDVISDETCCPLSSLRLKSSFKTKFAYRTIQVLTHYF